MPGVVAFGLRGREALDRHFNLGHFVPGREVGAQLHEQRLAAGDEGGVGIDGVGLGCIDEQAQVVGACQQQRDQRLADVDAPVAHFVEHALGHVGEGNQRVEPEEAGRALDGVRGAEDRVDGLGGVLALVQAQQRGLHVVEQLPALCKEGLQSVVHVHVVFSLRMRSGRHDQRVAEVGGQVEQLQHVDDDGAVAHEAQLVATLGGHALGEQQ